MCGVIYRRTPWLSIKLLQLFFQSKLWQTNAKRLFSAQKTKYLQDKVQNSNHTFAEYVLYNIEVVQ
jgi:hypothetical protein